MKRVFYLLISLAGGFTVFAQNPSFSPGSFTAEDQVTLTIDVTGTPLAGATEAYIWIFSNPDVAGSTSNNGTVNGEFNNSTEDAKMVAGGANVWKFTFTGTILFGQAPAELKSFGFLVKNKNGSSQTQDYKPFSFDPLVFVASMLRVFPAKVGADDVVTLNFDKEFGVTVNEQRMTPVSVTITMLDDQNPALVIGSALTIPVTKSGETIWSGTFIPSLSFSAPAGRKLSRFRYKFNGTIADTEGVAITVSSSEAEVAFSALH